MTVRGPKDHVVTPLSVRSAIIGGLLVIAIAIGGAAVTSFAVASGVPAGPAGPAGADGRNGEDGVDGWDGEDGRDGADGARGPAGPAGPQGPQGPQGAQGETGTQGIPGPQGADGAPGEDGLGVALSRYEAVAGRRLTGDDRGLEAWMLDQVTSVSPDVEAERPGASAVTVLEEGFYRVSYATVVLSGSAEVHLAFTLGVDGSAPQAVTDSGLQVALGDDGSTKTLYHGDLLVYLLAGDRIAVHYVNGGGVPYELRSGWFRVDRIA